MTEPSRRLGQFDTGAGFPVDVDLSKDGKYLYVLVSTLNAADNTGHIDIYRVNRRQPDVDLVDAAQHRWRHLRHRGQLTS